MDHPSILEQPLTNKKQRTGASVNAYLILRDAESVLLSLRANTGYSDGLYSLVAGHVENGESATAAIVREAHEEAGIRISPADLKVVHVLHRQSDRLNIDIFFECNAWHDEIINREPEKCADLRFFPPHAFPTNMIDYVTTVLQAVNRGHFYSEHGWNDLK